MKNEEGKRTHFGYQNIAWHEKEDKVKAVFLSVAKNYDLMNNLMSFGIHHFWKYYTIELAKARPGQKALDLAGGSGDLTKLLAKKVGDSGRVVLADINEAMLAVGRDRLFNDGIFENIDFVQANAENLPFETSSFDYVVMSFGLRNVRDKEAALRSIYRVSKPGAKLMILEFSKPTHQWLSTLYDWYSFSILPKLGKLIANDESSYLYLAESIRMHPDQEGLKTLIEKAGFEDCHYHNLNGGIVALHRAYKY